jgi:alpha-glucosidase
VNAATESDDARSVLHLYRRLLAARRGSPALQAGSWTALANAPSGVLAYARVAGLDRRQVWANFSGAALACGVTAGQWLVDVSTSQPAAGGTPWDGRLGPEEAVVVRPG